MYYEDLSINSPYNTYKNFGLPPLPICSPDTTTIDAVINAEKHNYIFMCASSKKIGYHNFSREYNKHQKNAKKYQNYLDNQQIK